MFCPRCRSEFREDVTFCAHCEIELVTEAPREDLFASPESMARMLRDVELERLLVGDHVALRQAQTALAEARIASVIAGETEETETAMHARFFLLVAAGDVPGARAFLQRRWRDGLAREGTLVDADSDVEDRVHRLHGDAEPLDAAACPACGSPIGDDVEECPDCGLFVGAGV